MGFDTIEINLVSFLYRPYMYQMLHIQSGQIERIQKQAFRIILEQNYINYEVACTLLSMEPLDIRRVQLCLTLEKREFKKTISLFIKSPKVIQTRSTENLVKEYRCRTKRFQNSSMPFLCKLLNYQ